MVKAKAITARPRAAPATGQTPALPAALEPELATLVDKPQPGNWLYEIKFDGYRMLSRNESGAVRLITRNGNDWTDRFPHLVKALQATGLPDGWYDGEIVVQDDEGRPDFNALQKAIEGGRNRDIVMFLFDCPFLAGADLRTLPVEERRAALQEVLVENDQVRFSTELEGPVSQLVASACHMRLEGIIGKRRGSRYVHGRSPDWIKLKCGQRQEFVIGGWTLPDNASSGIGAILVGYYDETGGFHYGGKVGTGFTGVEMASLHAKLTPLVTEKRPFIEKTGYERRATWVRPQLVCEIQFAEWTPDWHVRHASYKGVRQDKAAGAIRRESALPPPAKVPKGLKVSNPKRVIDPSTGITKLHLVAYYDAVADFILPHLKNRPVSLVRAPQGIAGQLFFQKHPEAPVPGLDTLDPALWPGHAALLTVNTRAALLSAAQLNTIEFHTWNSTAKAIDDPDRVIFDLDPGEGVTWAHVQEAASLTRTMLEQLGLKAWLKTSGGKGLHVVVPLAPKLDYKLVKAFSETVVVHMAKTIPQRFVAKSGGSNRIGKIFIDYLRNGHGQTTAAAFSARSRPGMGVSMPVAWEQLADLRSGAQWNVLTAAPYLSRREVDPWADYVKSRQTITKALRLLS
ncbi:DNA ligase D [Caenimonas sedimenti]|uniref:DNA ligase (ATP) n=2 Tax=Caenimonas sedimenti TaxID=2596921 RepID=A0A562ZGR7_9BURK|nr:DNA ligase D [Caenimonas sedimenti]